MSKDFYTCYKCGKEFQSNKEPKKLVQNFKIEDSRTLSIRFRGINKESNIIPIENYVCHIVYNNKNAFLSSYVLLNDHFETNSNLIKKKIKIEIELPDDYKTFFEYLELNFNIEKKEYLEILVRKK